MIKLISLATLLAATSLLLAACGADSNANLANTVGVGPVNVNTSNMPPGFSTSPLPINGTPTPGIPGPDQRNSSITNTTAPGIDPKNVNVKPRPGATATPGIPSPEELRRQMQQRSNSTAADGPSMMRSTNGATMMRSANTNGPRTARKP